MSSFSVPTARSLKFCDLLPFTLSQYVPEYVNYLDYQRSVEIFENGVTLST